MQAFESAVEIYCERTGKNFQSFFKTLSFTTRRREENDFAEESIKMGPLTVTSHDCYEEYSEYSGATGWYESFIVKFNGIDENFGDEEILRNGYTNVAQYIADCLAEWLE